MGQEVSHQVPKLKRKEEQQHDVDDDKLEEDERAHLKGGIYMEVAILQKWEEIQKMRRMESPQRR